MHWGHIILRRSRCEEQWPRVGALARGGRSSRVAARQPRLECARQPRGHWRAANAAAQAAALSAQALTTVFLLADLGHRLQLRSLDIEFGTSVLQTAKSSAKAILNMPQFRRIITSSQHVVRNIRLIVDLGVIYVLLVVWGFVPEFGVLPVEETGIRIAAVIAVIFLTEVRTRRRTTWTDA